MPISYVGVSAAWTSSAASNSYTLNLPSTGAGMPLQDGDFMVAFLVWTTGGSNGPILSVSTNPSGWTRQDVVTDVGDTWPTQVAIFTRTYATGDPSTWTGTLSASSAKVKVSGTVAYRGVQSLLTKGTNEASSGSTTYNIPASALNATVSGCWRVAGAGVEWQDFAASLAINDTSRLLGQASAGADFIQLRIADSNGTIATGTSGGNRTVSKSGSWDSSAGWLGLLAPSSGTPAIGDWSSMLDPVEVAATGEVHADGSIAATLSPVTMAWAADGAPVPSTGSFASTLSPVTMAWAAGAEPTGSFAMTLTPVFAFQGETRSFGVRVILVDNDLRRIVVPSRGVDD